MKMLKLLTAVIFAAALPCAALAQTSPGLTYGQVPTPGQWNSYFAAKQDVLGFTPMNVNGGVFLGRVVTAPPGATTAGLNLTPGTTPGSPADGDLWITPSSIFAQINGATVDLVGAPCTNCALTTNPLSQFASTTSAQLAGIISNETGTGLLVFNNGPALTSPVITGPLALPSGTTAPNMSLTTPSLGVATGTSLALGGATLGSNALAVAGSALFGNGLTADFFANVLSSSATCLTAGLNGSTNPALQVDCSVASQASGVKISGAATGGTVAISAIDSGANTNLTLDAKGGGQVTIGGASGSVKLASASNIISGAITYGGVALNNAVTGTGNMVLSASPSFTGTAAFAALSATGQITSTLATGTAPFSVTSTTNVANLNASSLNGATFANPGAVGSGTASSGAFTTLSASSTVSGAGFTTYLASPPAIGGTAPGAGAFTTLSASGAVTGVGFTTYLSAPPAIGGGTPNAGSFSILSATTGGSLAGTFTGSPAFSGSPTAVTQSAGDNSTKLATTAYVNAAVPNGSQTWTPTPTNLTVVNGTGAATVAGKYTKVANIVYWTITVTVSGTATTASTANSTSFSLPTTPVGFGVGAAVDANVVSFGEGISSGGSSVFFAPTWSARNTNITISGWYFTS